jgi:zinc protease
MFKGTPSHPGGEFSSLVAAIGGQENAFTTADYTAYHQTVAREFLPLVMELEADRMANLVLTDEVVLPERDVILEERRSRIENDPGSLLSESVNATLYQNSPYGIPIIGWAHEIEQLDREDAVTFYDRYYTPNNAILVVAGDVTEAEVRALAEETYGAVARRAEPPARDWATEPPPLTERTVTMSDPRVTQTALNRAYLVPSYLNDVGNEGFALDLLADIIGNGPTSRLYRTLVVESGQAAAAGSYYGGTAVGSGRFGLYAVPRGETSLEDLAAAVDAVLAEVRENGVTAEELARAKRRVVAGAIYSQDSQAAMARYVGAGMTVGLGLEELKDLPRNVQEVTLDEVNAAARVYLDPKRSVTGYLVAPEPDERS